jgi:hypothetical protein
MSDVLKTQKELLPDIFHAHAPHQLASYVQKTGLDDGRVRHQRYLRFSDPHLLLGIGGNLTSRELDQVLALHTWESSGELGFELIEVFIV